MRLRRLAPAALAALTGCSSRFGAPDPASEQGEDVLSLWRGTFIAALVVGGLVVALIVFALVHYRRRTDALHEHGRENVRVELLYTMLPVAVVAGLFLFTVRTEDEVNHLRDEPPDLTIQVLGFQWQWQFTYVDAGVEVIGSEGEPPELVLPVGAVVRFDLETADVIHSFWVPRFLYKRDLIPGVENVIDIEVTEVGVFRGVCAEFCGLDHAAMDFVVRVVPAEEFDTWLGAAQRAQQADGDGGG